MYLVVKIYQTSDADFFAAETEAEVKAYVLTHWVWDEESWADYNFSSREVSRDELDSYYTTEGLSWSRELDKLVFNKAQFPTLFISLG